MFRPLLLTAVVLLGGCALAPRTTQIASERPAHPETAPFALNGRVAIEHRGERHSAGLHWTHRPQSDEILLLTPLGQTAARIYRDPLAATLDENGKHYKDTNAEALMQQVLGWHLPLAGLHQWVLGLPAAETPAEVEPGADGHPAGLRQDGWEVRYLRYAGDQPTRIQLSREDLHLQLLIDEWDWSGQ